MTAMVLILALLLDRLLGELPRLHPLVGYGRLVAGMEALTNRVPSRPIMGRFLGMLALLLLVVPIPLLLSLWALPSWAEWGLAIALVYLALGARSLAEHARAVADALKASDLSKARRRVGYLVSRDCAEMDEAAVSRATMESVLENGNDAIFGVLFWFVVGGLPAAVGYRLVNTLDAMWGYRTERFHYFGWAAARLDDLLNWVPARLTALSYALLGKTAVALSCWRQQGAACKSPNAGPVMAAGAGALSCRLGGGAWYHGSWVERPQLGFGEPPEAEDIDRAVLLVERSILLWVAVTVLGEVLTLA